jgi:hypothetical protein
MAAHEIKHDGFRVIARKKGAQVRLYSRPGNDLILIGSKKNANAPAMKQEANEEWISIALWYNRSKRV